MQNLLGNRSRRRVRQHIAATIVCAALTAIACCMMESAAIAEGRCLLVCPAGQRLDEPKCSCEKSAPLSPCALVCPPDQKLDAKRCQCIQS